MRIAAVDQGTTSTRTLLVDGNEARIVHTARHRQHYPQSGWVEHDPLELLANIRAGLAACGRVDAIGIDNQGESCLAWDAVSRAPLSPVIVWQDSRTSDAIGEMKQAGAEALALDRAGLPLDPYFSASKFRWLIDNIPAVRSALAEGRLRLGTTDAFFLDHLTGAFATDVTTASRTGLMNIQSAQWDDDLCRLYGVPRQCLPEIRPTTGPFGTVDGVPVTCSIVDQQAALYGHGCRRPGDAKITFGTGAFALAVTGDTVVQAADKGLLPTIAWQTPDGLVRAADGGVYDAGSAVEWAGRLGLYADVAELGAFAAPPAIERGLAFVPALSGLGCPHWDRSAAAVWVGMTAETSRQDLCQALLEGIALRIAEVIETLDSHVPIATRVSIDGGLTRSAYFCQFLADVLDREVVTSRFDELTVAGVAALAASGFDAPPIALMQVAQRYVPAGAVANAYRERFRQALTRSVGWRN